MGHLSPYDVIPSVLATLVVLIAWVRNVRR